MCMSAKSALYVVIADLGTDSITVDAFPFNNSATGGNYQVEHWPAGVYHEILVLDAKTDGSRLQNRVHDLDANYRAAGISANSLSAGVVVDRGDEWRACECETIPTILGWPGGERQYGDRSARFIGSGHYCV